MRVECELTPDEVIEAVSLYLWSRDLRGKVTELAHNFDRDRLTLVVVVDVVPAKTMVRPPTVRRDPIIPSGPTRTTDPPKLICGQPPK